MNEVVDVVSAVLLVVALFFFTAGTVGLIRLPDVHSRLHALTKADNVGLGFAVFAFLLQVESGTAAMKLILVWLLVLAAGATVSYLIAQRALPASTDNTGEDRR